MKYRIQINAIDESYDASSEDEALEKYANDAGYSSYAEIKELFPDDQLIVTKETNLERL